MVRRPQFLDCYDSGRKYHSRHFLLFVLGREDADTWRLGLAVSKKMGGAVKRNRIKRVLREFFRLHRHMIGHPLDVVAVPKRHLEARKLTLQMAVDELAPLLARMGKDLSGSGSGLRHTHDGPRA